MTNAQAARECITYQIQSCALGRVLVAWSALGVCAILLGDDDAALLAELSAAFPAAQLVVGTGVASPWVAQVHQLVAEPAHALTFPLDIRGTAFQQRVWAALRQIPAGQTCSYTQVAQSLGQPRAVRAVAGACAANVLAVAIPCHRVRRRDGGLSGYRWGMARKQALLAREAPATLALGACT